MIRLAIFRKLLQVIYIKKHLTKRSFTLSDAFLVILDQIHWLELLLIIFRLKLIIIDILRHLPYLAILPPLVAKHLPFP